MAELKAIETVYNGYKFRSRLEARWAVFFSTLGIKYEYESQGYDLGNRLWYLPDFWLPEHDFWIEIKGTEPTENELLKAAKLAWQARKDVYIFCGQIYNYEIPNTALWYSGRFHREEGELFELEKAWGDLDQMWCECSICHKFGIEFDGRSDRLPCKECYTCAWNEPCQLHPIKSTAGCERVSQNKDKGYNAESPQLVKAYLAARQARF